MLGPGLKPRERRAYDRTQSWASNYYKGWAARIQAEREARQLAGTIPDELMNEFSDSDDEKAIQITRHVPTPQSMPSSPMMASIPKPIDSGVPYKSSFIETQSVCYDGGCSPIDIDTQPLDSASWQRPSQRSDHQSLKRFPSDLSDSSRKSSVKTRSRSAGSTKFFNLAAGSKKASAATKHSRRSSSSRTSSSMMYSSNDGGAVHQVRRGRVAKRRSYHRGPI